MARKHFRAALLLLGALICQFPYGCAARQTALSQKEAVTPTGTPPGRDRMMQRQQLAKGFQPLKTVRGTPQREAAVAALLGGDPRESLANGHRNWKSPSLALDHFRRIRESEPTSCADLAPFCFFWIADLKEELTPARLSDAVTSPTAPAKTFAEIQHDGLQTSLSLQSGQLSSWLPEEGEDGLYRYTPTPTDPNPRPQAVPSTHPVRAEAPPADVGDTEVGRWSTLEDKGESLLLPDQARVLAAAHDLAWLLSQAASSAVKFPSTLDELQRYSGQVLINLVPCREEDAEITLGFDGVQAYEVRAVFENRSSFDTVLYCPLLSSDGSVFVARSFQRFQEQVGRPIQPFAYLRLVPEDQAALPIG